MQHEHEDWQLREGPDGSWYCAACGEPPVMAGDRAIQLFNQFIRQYVDPSLHGHFADNDNNAAERVRQAIREVVDYLT